MNTSNETKKMNENVESKTAEKETAKKQSTGKKTAIDKEDKKTVFNELKSVKVDISTADISGKKLKYLTWAKAWEEVKSRFPDAKYDVKKFGEAQLPFQFVPGMGYMVYTSVTINEETIEMFRPVLNKQELAMKETPYEVVFINGESTSVPSATMADINNTIMRCLVKNIAMFGLGLHLYAGEDVPFNDEEDENGVDEKATADKEQDKISVITKNVNEFIIGKDKVSELKDLSEKTGISIEDICRRYEKKTLDDFTYLDYRSATAVLGRILSRQD